MGHEIAQRVTGLTIRDDDPNSIGRENTTPTGCPLAYTDTHTNLDSMIHTQTHTNTT